MDRPQNRSICMLSRSEFERIEIQHFTEGKDAWPDGLPLTNVLTATRNFTAAELRPQLLPAFQLGVVNFDCEFLLLSLRP